MRPQVALLGLDPRVLAIGFQALSENFPLAGIWASDHNEALLASLRLGCCAFPDPHEVVRQAHWIVFSEWPDSMPGQGLDVRTLELEGKKLRACGLSSEWQRWLSGLGFEVASSG